MAKKSKPRVDKKVEILSTPTIITHKVPEHFRFHLLSLVHLPQSKEYLSCAFTQKNRKLAKMLTSLGHEVFFYGSESSDVEEYCNSDKLHFIQTHTLADISKDWGDGDNRFEIGYNWHNVDFRHDFNTNPKKSSTMKFYDVTINYINKHKKPDDFFLNTMGYYFKNVEDAVGLFLSCESGIGYRGSYGPHYRSFESSYIQNFSYGSAAPFQDLNGSYYDRVIPNYFDPDDFEVGETPGDYYLFIGRMIKRKGIITAALACQAIGAKLIIAGQGASVRENGHLIPNDTPDFDLSPMTWEYVGYKGIEERRSLMANAIATFVPTEYLEIFGGTSMEAMLSGSPPITTNFGVFPGTIPDVINGKLGFRCNTLQDFAEAAVAAKDVDRKAIRKYGERYLMDVVKLEFDKWFRDLYHVYLSATYPGELGWHWLPDNYPLKKE
jgi:glycosyltransferase involved in cell wall biosynthesis